jgi:hypothetical protein
VITFVCLIEFGTRLPFLMVVGEEKTILCVDSRTRLVRREKGGNRNDDVDNLAWRFAPDSDKTGDLPSQILPLTLREKGRKREACAIAAKNLDSRSP